MRLPEICIRRPVFATVMSVILILIGLVCGSRLQIMEYPKISKPSINVTTEYSGANTNVIETGITKIMEEQFARIEGVDTMTSTSYEGTSKITIQFRPERSLDAAASDIRDAIGKVKRNLPQDIRDPILKKATTDETPVVYIALSSESRSPEDIADYAKRDLETEFVTLDGVAAATVVGGGEFRMNIWLDPVKLAAYNLTAPDVNGAISRQNKDFSAGRITAGDREYLVSTPSGMVAPEQFDQLIITNPDRAIAAKDTYVRLSDVGRAEFSSNEKTFRILYNGKNTVMLTVVAQSNANPLDVARLVKERINILKEKLPADMKMEIALDFTTFIEESIYQVYETIAIATLLVLAVIFAFLGTVRASVIPLVTIPVSLIGACIILYVFGFSLNILTLLSFVLAIGLVVDDAIIVLENVYRHIERGETPMNAAIKGSKEIAFAVIAMTITLAAVYAPLALASGITGKYFKEFALTLAGAVVISGFVALTLSPMMCSKFLKAHVKKEEAVGWKDVWLHKIDSFLNYLDDLYARALRVSMNYRSYVIGLSVLISISGYILAVFFIDKELNPEQDRGQLSIRAMPPAGPTLDYVARYMDEMDQELERVPEVKSRLSIVELPNGKGFSILEPWSKRKRSAKKIAESTQEKFDKIAGVQAKVFPSSSALGASGSADDRLQFLILTNRTHAELQGMTRQMMAALGKRTQQIKGISAATGADSREYVVSINKDKAAMLKIDPGVIGETLEIMGKGKVPSRIKRDGREYDVVVQVEEKYRKKPQDLTDIYVRADKGEMVSLSDLIIVDTKTAAQQVEHFDRLRSMTLFASIAPGSSFSEAVAVIQETAKEVLPEGSRIEWSGETRQYFEEQANIYLVFALALAFIYLVLCAQFESFVDPLVIMLSVPLSIVGALITLKMTNGTLNLFSQIGLVTLIGLITKHGILIVDFANAKLEAGMDRVEAAVDASKMRLRPILMTTAAMVLGAVPLALASGPGAELRQQIGWVIVGGMSFGTLFTLFIVPVVYTFVGAHKNFDWKKMLREFLSAFRRKPEDQAP